MAHPRLAGSLFGGVGDVDIGQGDIRQSVVRQSGVRQSGVAVTRDDLAVLQNAG